MKDILKISKKLLIVFMIIIISVTFFTIPKINNEVSANPAIAIPAAVATVAIVVIIIVLMAISDEDIVDILQGYVQDFITAMTIGAENLPENYAILKGKFNAYILNFYSYIENNTIQSEAFYDFVEQINYYIDANTQSESEIFFTVFYRFLQGDLDINKNLVLLVNDWAANLGYNYDNIVNYQLPFEVDSRQYADLTNGIDGTHYPIFSQDTVEYFYRAHNNDSTLLNKSSDLIVELGAFDLHREFRNNDGTYSIMSGALPKFDEVLGTVKLYSIYLKDDLIIHIHSYWTETMTRIFYSVEDTTLGTILHVNVDTEHYVYTNNWHDIYSDNTGAINKNVFMSMIGYSVNVQRFFIYTYLVDTLTGYVIQVKKFPLNDTPGEFFRFDNSVNVMSDYTIENVAGESTSILTSDTALDIDFDDWLFNNGLTLDISDNLVLPETQTWEDQFSDTLVNAISDALENIDIDVIVDVQSVSITHDSEVPEKLKKFRLPSTIKTKFPFCLPWDLYHMVELMEQPPVDDYIIDLSFDVSFADVDIVIPVIIDLEMYNLLVLAKIMRYFMLVSFGVMLIMQSRKMVMA